MEKENTDKKGEIIGTSEEEYLKIKRLEKVLKPPDNFAKLAISMKVLKN